MGMNRDVFKNIILASRSLDKCYAIKESMLKKGLGEISVEQVDADDTQALVALIQKYKPKVVINVALPYQDLTIMQACLETKTHYIDTANYEHPDLAKFEYKEQWAFDRAYKEARILGILGAGFDPGVTNAYVAHAQKHHFDTIHTLDILDCNAGDHKRPFATNFNPEINLREVSSKGRYYENGKWIETKPLEIKQVWAYPQIGEMDSYLLYHEELESLVKNIKGLRRARFFMTFSQNYLTHMKCLENVGMLGIKEIEHQGTKIVPIQFLKTLLPDPTTLAKDTTGKTNIGCYMTGIKNNQDKTLYIYNVCDHKKCYEEVGSQAISYTTGVPAMCTAKMICNDTWSADHFRAGVFNIEELNTDPFMEELIKQGLPYEVIER
ncbi:Carboxynorspermidine dehydrogenase [Helicobacter pylori BM012A]|uniref:Carboxynorspermidine dehydrogenase n=2 Tax=Helicobacter pylori TaxID=210 RepID=V5NPA2_HELPX|nr:Carboxynorspermidine dehydrogenase [Helicobacter pylori BM012A]AHA90430.1 Carboxynorspermidine dehydrogenase [Helicobacter pylori BM012S]